MTEPRADDFLPVAPLDELKAKGMMVVRGERCPLLVVHDRGCVFALDNRCPHLGFPLHRGSVEDGILTCHWHHARFDLASGGTFDLWADDVPTAAVELRDGMVRVASRTRYADGDAHWRNRLRDGMEQDIGLVIAKAVLGLLGEGADPRDLLRDAVLFGVRNRDGWGAGLTILTALGNLLPLLLPEEETYLALYQGISRVAEDCDGATPRRDRQKLPDGTPEQARLQRWLRHWTRVRHRDGAERTLLTAIEGGVAPAELAAMMLTAVTDRAYADEGHALDFVNKAFEALDLIGWEHAAAVLPAVAGQMVAARGGEETDAWRHPVDLIALCETAVAALPAALAEGTARRGQWQAHPALAEAILGDVPAAMMAALQSAIRDGAGPTDLSRALACAAALRIARFGTANEVSDWDTAHHVFTYCNALHQMLKRVTAAGRSGSAVPPAAEPELLRGVIHGAMAVYLIRFLNIPPARLPDGADPASLALPAEADALRAAFLDALDRQGGIRTAARLVARYRALGHPTGPLLATLARAVLREDAGFHTIQMLEAGIRQYTEWGDGETGGRILVAVARFLAAHAPTRRARLQTADVAQRLSRGQDVSAAAGDAEDG